MFENQVTGKLLYIILIAGICFRFTLFVVNPPNNSFDDHMEPIYKIASSMERPDPAACWECYQPPAYYFLGAVVFNLTHFAGFGVFGIWKCIQTINLILSILLLWIFIKILTVTGVDQQHKILYLSFLAVLPRDVFTSAMISNDYLLVLCALTAVLFFLKSIKNIENQVHKSQVFNFVMTALFAVLGSLTKQHGVLLFMLPATLFVIELRRRNRLALKVFLPVLIAVLVLSLSDELWKYSKIGIFLVSNQHFFDFASHQFPGRLDMIEFTSIRFIELFKNPFITPASSSSFFTEIFARIFFDYEPKFLSPNNKNLFFAGRFAYAIGIVWIIFFLVTFILWLKRKFTTKFNFSLGVLSKLVLVVLALGYVAVPILQTIRFPYYSSMKAMFMLPGLIILLALHPVTLRNIVVPKTILNSLLILNLLLGLVLAITISCNIQDYLSQYKQLWYYP